MIAVVLAAGLGKRLAQYTKDKPKCMVEVGGLTLIERLLRQISVYQVTKIVAVVGHCDEILKEHIKSFQKDLKIEADFVFNEKYYFANNIYSLYVAREYFVEDILLFEADLLFCDEMIKQAFESKNENFVLVSPYENWMDGTVVTINQDSKISNMIFWEDFEALEIGEYYKTANIYKFSKSFMQKKYLPILERYISDEKIECYYEVALKEVILEGDFRAEVSRDCFWCEIDNPNDLYIAQILYAKENEQYSLLTKSYGGYWRFPKIKDFCYLVNPYFPCHNMKEEMKNALDVLLSNYPSGMKVQKILASTMLKVLQRYIAVGNGAAELIKALMRNISGKVGIVIPTFEEYVNAHLGEVEFYDCKKGESYSYTSQDIIAFIKDKNLSAMIIIAPDNPSGFMIKKDEMVKILKYAKGANVRVIFDESFMDFASDEFRYSLIQNEILEKYHNLVVIKSISKSYGVAGLRLGMAISADLELVEGTIKECSIWNINAYAEYFMQLFPKYKNDFYESCVRLRDSRARFMGKLKEIQGLKIFESQANFVLCEVLDESISMDKLLFQCLKQGYFIKDCSNKLGFDKGHFLRLVVRTDSENDGLARVLKDFLEKR